MAASVAVLGQRADVVNLFEEICSFDRKCKDLPVDKGNVSVPMMYTVNTKYFSAPIELSQYELNSDGCFSGPVEGIIIYIAAKDAKLLQQVKLPSDSQQCKLLLVNSAASLEDSEDASRMELINWSLDHGFEYIDLPTGLQNPTKDWSVREKDGFPRAMEAIHSTIWSSANKFVDTNRPVSKSSVASAGACAAADAPSSSLSEASGGSASVDNTKKKKSKKTSGASKDEEELMKLDSLETIFQKVKEQRSALQQSSSAEASGSALSQADIDRRAKAAQMAMELCSIMNLCESDSDYESDSDD
jgi:hypothetical protein